MVLEWNLESDRKKEAQWDYPEPCPEQARPDSGCRVALEGGRQDTRPVEGMEFSLKS